MTAQADRVRKKKNELTPFSKEGARGGAPGAGNLPSLDVFNAKNKDSDMMELVEKNQKMGKASKALEHAIHIRWMRNGETTILKKKP